MPVALPECAGVVYRAIKYGRKPGHPSGCIIGPVVTDQCGGALRVYQIGQPSGDVVRVHSVGHQVAGCRVGEPRNARPATDRIVLEIHSFLADRVTARQTMLQDSRHA